MKFTLQRGFSFIELMVGSLIVVIIGGIAIISFSEYSERSEVLEMQNFLTQVAEKQQSFYNDNRRYTEDLGELGITGGVPENIRDSAKIFRIGVSDEGDGRQTYMAVINPDRFIARYKDFQPLVIDSEDNRYHSSNFFCKFIKETDSFTYIRQKCALQEKDHIWGDPPTEKFPSVEDIESGKVIPPIPLTKVANNCAYAIAIRDQDLFDKLNCEEDYRWPYVSEEAQPISDKCLEAFNDEDRVAFSANQCCKSIKWVSKASGFCNEIGSAQPPSPAAYTSPASAGQIKLYNGKCIHSSGTHKGILRTAKCQPGNDAQKWYRGEDGLWHNKAKPELCIRGGFPTPGYYDNRFRTARCNKGDGYQRGFSYDEDINQLRNRWGCAGTRWNQVRSARCRQHISNPLAVDIDSQRAAIFGSKPECLSIVNRENIYNDFNEFKNAGCCELGEWIGGRGLNCQSPIISFPTTPESAKTLRLGSEVSIVIYSRGKYTNQPAVFQWTDQTLNKYGQFTSNKWYQAEDGSLRSPDYPDLCLTMLGQGANYKKLRMRTCDGGIRQKWITVGGQIRSKLANGRYCLTSAGYKTTTNQGFGPWPCNSRTPSFMVE